MRPPNLRPNWRKNETSKHTFVALCLVLLSCTAKAPSSAQIEAALNKLVKKDSPNASVKLTDIQMNQSGNLVLTEFTCTGCVVGSGADRKTLPSAKGEADVLYLDKWKLDDVYVKDDAGERTRSTSMAR